MPYIKGTQTELKIMIHKGDTVRLKPRWQDDGDSKFKWVALDNEEKGRVTICPINIKLTIKPQYIVKTEWLERS